jgi:predicted Fe-Mo cluster-binding NifX family protein
VKAAFTTSGSDLNAPLDPRFGRALKILIYDLEDETFTTLDNGANVNMAQGAGIKAAETIAQNGANVLITGHCGPKAFRALAAAGIKIYNTQASTVAEALEKFKTGSLSQAKTADVQGHWT